MSTNSFTSAIADTANYTVGDNGGVIKKSSGNPFVDNFTNLNKDSSVESIKTGIENMLYYAENSENIGECISNIFRLWCHKRHAREGEKEKLLSYRYFLELYNYYPETCISIAKSGLFGDIGYWKDYMLIWGMINKMEMCDNDRYVKYNRLIESFRYVILKQRTHDLYELSKCVSPNTLGKMDNEKLESMIRSGDKKISISYVGKYMIREKSVENSNLCWYIKKSDGKLYKDSHVSYMLRFMLRKRNGEGELMEYPLDNSVPFGAKKTYRRLNCKLNIVLNVPEVLMCSERFGDMDPNKLPSQFMKRNAKALLNEKLKVKPTIYEEENGNRDPDNEGRVSLRKRMREMFRDPSKVNSGQIFPHNIANSVIKANSTASSEMAQAMWDSKILDTLKKLDETRKKMIEGEVEGSAMKLDIAKALSSGRFIGCADVSASMTWVGKEPERPYDIAIGLTSFLSEIAAPEYRDIALSFTSNPSVFSFKVGDRKMTAKERLTHIMKYSGGSTNYEGLHKEVLRICKNNSVKEEDIPVIVVFTDGQFDSMDPNLGGYNYYSYSNTNRGVTSNKWETIHERIVQMWVDSGYKKIPTIVYWNLNSETSNVQEDSKYPGVMFLQGRSANNIKYILYGECAEEKEIDVNGTKVKVSSITPYDTFKIAMNQDYFDKLNSILMESNEKLLINIS